jgi:DNA-binding NarL/FixJ family response regulator
MITIIVDDEPYCCETITTLFEDCDEVEIVAECYNGIDALNQSANTALALFSSMWKCQR